MNSTISLDSGEDFPLNGGKLRLAKLFESDPGDEVSLKYKAPKEPPNMKPHLSNSRTLINRVPLKVIMGKTVEAFKMENGKYISFGKVGAAILGNDEKNHYEIYIYRNDEQKVTSADIEHSFQFLVHVNNYVMFHNKFGEGWSLHFERGSDMAEFCKEVALAKWRSSKGKEKKIIQDTVYGNCEKCVEVNDLVLALYRVFPLFPVNMQVGQELPKRTLSSPADSAMWEVNIIGAFLKSVRVIILPNHLLDVWAEVTPKGCDLLLEMEIQDIKSRTLPVGGLHIPQPRSKEGSIKSSRSGVMSRISRMGQPLVPFPNFPTKESDSDDSADAIDITPQDVKRSKGYMTVQGESSSSDASSHNETSILTTEQILQTMQPFPTDEMQIFPQNLAINAQFNVMFSEIRTCNSELRMNLVRLSDKVETVLSKIDSSHNVNTKKLNNVSHNLDCLNQSHQVFKTFLDDTFSKLSCQSENILRHSGYSDSTRDNKNNVEELWKKNVEDDESLLALNCESASLEDKPEETKEPTIMVGKQKETLEKYEKEFVLPKNCSCNSEERIKNLEVSLQNFKARNNELNGMKTDLERKNDSLETIVHQLTKEKLEIIEHFMKEKQDSSVRQKNLEEEMEWYKLKVKEKEDNEKLLPKSLVLGELEDVVKKLMNLTYKSLKVLLTKNDSTQIVSENLPNALRLVANTFLDQYSNLRSSSGDNSPRESLKSGHREFVLTREGAFTKSGAGVVEQSLSCVPDSFPPNSPLPSIPIVPSSCSPEGKLCEEINCTEEKLHIKTSETTKDNLVESENWVKNDIMVLHSKSSIHDEVIKPKVELKSQSNSSPEINLYKSDGIREELCFETKALQGQRNSSDTSKVAEKEAITSGENASNRSGQDPEAVFSSKSEFHSKRLERNEGQIDTVPISSINASCEVSQKVQDKVIEESIGLIKEDIASTGIEFGKLVFKESPVLISNVHTEKQFPYSFVPIIQPDPPPFTPTPSPSPSPNNYGNSLSSTLFISDDESRSLREDSLENFWQLQPPSIDDGNEDDWSI